MSDNYDNTPTSYFEEDMRAIIDGTQFPSRPPKSKMEELLKELNDTIKEGGGGGGTTNYNLLQNKPSINSVTLTGNKTSADLGIPTNADLAGKQDVLPVTASGNDVAFNGELIDGQGNTLSVLAEALTKTASGNPVVISDCAGGKARSLKTTIEALQDLHGYDKPWSGGADVNKCNPSVNSVTVPVNTTQAPTVGILVLTETKTVKASWNQSTSITAAVRNCLELKVLGENTYYYPTNTTTPSLDEGYHEGIIENVPAGTYEVKLWTQGTAGNEYTATQFMVRDASISDNTFRPYSNICPISGRTEAVVTRSDGDEISEDFTIQLGQTVYGADINWDTGVMTVLDAIADMGDLTWTYNGTSQVFNSSVLPGATTENVYTDAISSSYKEHQTGMSAMVNGDFRVLDGVMTVKDTAYTDATAFKTAVTGQTVCYKLATPTTLQLTPTQLQMLKGYNRVSIDNGTITLDYIAKAISGNDEEIAPLVGDKATKSYAVNDFIERNDGLYRVTASIASGASFTANNTVKMSIGEALTYLYNK